MVTYKIYYCECKNKFLITHEIFDEYSCARFLIRDFRNVRYSLGLFFALNCVGRITRYLEIESHLLGFWKVRSRRLRAPTRRHSTMHRPTTQLRSALTANAPFAASSRASNGGSQVIKQKLLEFRGPGLFRVI